MVSGEGQVSTDFVSSILGRIMVISVRLVMVVAGDGCEFK